MTEHELRKLYGEDYQPPTNETTNALLIDEQVWVEQYTTDSHYNYDYAVFGKGRYRTNINNFCTVID